VDAREAREVGVVGTDRRVVLDRDGRELDIGGEVRGRADRAQEPEREMMMARRAPRALEVMVKKVLTATPTAAADR
jgi:hypothetical protein